MNEYRDDDIHWEINMLMVMKDTNTNSHDVRNKIMWWTINLEKFKKIPFWPTQNVTKFDSEGKSRKLWRFWLEGEKNVHIRTALICLKKNKNPENKSKYKICLENQSKIIIWPEHMILLTLIYKSHTLGLCG